MEECKKVKMYDNIEGLSLLEHPKVKSFLSKLKPRLNGKIRSMQDHIKQKISDPKIKVVSFDVFDTLVVRPFYIPSDLFEFLDVEFIKLFDIKSFYKFSQIRMISESRARERLRVDGQAGEEITLDDIYAQIVYDYGFDCDKLDVIKNKEIEMEINLCYQRKFAKELFDLAKKEGKKVIATSDMYLSQDVLKQMLIKNGYDFENIYVSSDRRATKQSGSLYSLILKDLNINGAEIVHIGDNKHSDFDMAKKNGWHACFLPRALDVFSGYNKDIYGGNIVASMENCSNFMDIRCSKWGFIGYRCVLAVIANRLFDNPFVSYNKDSNYNCDPFTIGYAALGPYLYAITKWIINGVEGKNISNIHFVARDGYLPMKAFELFKNHNDQLPNANYLYVSRKSMLLSDIYSKADIYSLSNKFNVFAMTPKKLRDIFVPILKSDVVKLSDLEFCKMIGVDGRQVNKCFNSKIVFNMAISKLSELLDFQKSKTYKSKLKTYFEPMIKKGDVLFDIGYSGRQESSLSVMLGFPIDSMYVHINNDVVYGRANSYKFDNATFYDYKPKITGVLREQVFMKMAPSVIGYDVSGKEVKPIFEKDDIGIETKGITAIIQHGALEFVNDMLNIFNGYIDKLYYKKEDLAFFFEYYLHYSKTSDRRIFECLKFEDDMGLGSDVNIVNIWNGELLSSTKNPQPTKSTTIRKSRLRRVADKLLPIGSKRRNLVKKIYYKFKRG